MGKILAGRYQITGILAAGGMGVIYDAVQVALGRPVALKCLHPRYAQDKNAVARFQREAELSGGFGHPHIVEVFDMGYLDDGVPFLVMERLDGETLAGRMKRERTLPVGLSVSIARQTLSALVVAHSKGVLHRDLKPDNIFLAHRAGVVPRVKVLDFGVALSLGDANRKSLKLTRAGFVMGTPAYMAPEQARGDTALDVRADLYSVGMMLYEMLVGKLPFSASSPAALLAEIHRVRPQTPSALRSDVPKTVDSVVMKSLASDRTKRYADAAEMSRALVALGVPEDDDPNVPVDDPTEISAQPDFDLRAEVEIVERFGRKR